MATLALRNVKKRFGHIEVVHGFDLDIADGEFVVFVGPSGCGKSTVLRMICGLEPLTEGEVVIDGHSARGVPPSRRGVAMVFQSYALYPHLSVAENMGFALRMAKVPRAERVRQIRRAAEILRLEELLERKPKELSGGQRQRVAIGRAIVREPKVFLFDEPLSNLDAELRVQMRFELAKLHRELGATMVYVTHDQVEAMTLADRIVVMREGYIEQVGTPMELYRTPRNTFVAGFIGSPRMNFLEAQVEAVDGARVVLRLAGVPAEPISVDAAETGLRKGESVTLGIRPEHLSPERSGDVQLEARIEFVEQLGGTNYLYAPDFGAGSLVMKSEGDRHEAFVGDSVIVGLQRDACHLFGGDGQAIALRGSSGALAAKGAKLLQKSTA
jgi:ABC-type sugar transport system ATPase subunit